MGFLTLLWLIPALGALVAALAPSRNASRAWALLVSGAGLLYSAWLLLPYGRGAGALRLEEIGRGSWLGIRYRMGVDGLSLPLIWLSAFLIVVALLSSRRDFSKGYWASFLALEAGLFGVFSAQNLFYFYLFWEAALIPMFFIIGLWGSEGRVAAAFKFILYTFLGSLALLVGLIYLVVVHHGATGIWTWDIPELARSPIAGPASIWIFAAILIGFAVKIPVLPLHHWLPDAHTEAPAAGSILLAGAMLKMGVYGLLRVLIPVFPDLSAAALPWLGGLGAANVVYGALCAMAQKDLKRLVAYTSISHLGFCLVGLFSLTSEGIAGAALVMVNHGLSTGGLFLLVGMLYDRAHRRGVSDFGDLASGAPYFAFFFAFILLSSIGLPGLNGFVGEMMSLAGMARVHWPLAAAGLGGTVLAAAYALPAYHQVFWAPAGPGSVTAKVTDMEAGERALLWALSAVILFLGLYPRPLLELMRPAVTTLAGRL